MQVLLVGTLALILLLLTLAALVALDRALADEPAPATVERDRAPVPKEQLAELERDALRRRRRSDG